MGWNDKLAEMLRLNDGEQAYVGYPQMQVGLNKPRQSGYATGFLEGATGMDSMQPKNPITDPNFSAYEQGKNTGEAVGIGAMALPGYAMALKAGAPKAAQMIENYMAKTGGISHIVPPNELKALPEDWNKLSTMATEAYEALRKNPSKQTHDYYKMIMEAKENAPLNNPKNVVAPVVKAEETYKGEHQAPMMDSGKPLHDLTDIYPEDFYTNKAIQYYGTGSDRDAYVISQLQSLRNRPNAEVWMYRAVPKNAPSAINKGDWVTIDRQYAKEHGESALNGDYKIIKRKASAKDLFTNGDSPFEMGYDPQPKMTRQQMLDYIASKKSVE